MIRHRVGEPTGSGQSDLAGLPRLVASVLTYCRDGRTPDRHPVCEKRRSVHRIHDHRFRLSAPVHIGARVAGQARAGELLTTSTVRDLVAGSGIKFEDRGESKLKGIPGVWRLMTVPR